MEIENIKQKIKSLRTVFMKSVNKLEDLLKATEQSINVIEICFEQLSEKYQNLRTKD